MVPSELPKEPEEKDLSDDPDVEQRDVYLYVDWLGDSGKVLQITSSPEAVPKAQERMRRTLGEEAGVTLTMDEALLKPVGASVILLVDHYRATCDKVLALLPKNPECRRLIVHGNVDAECLKGEFTHFETYRGPVQPAYQWQVFNRQLKTHKFLDKIFEEL